MLSFLFVVPCRGSCFQALIGNFDSTRKRRTVTIADSTGFGSNTTFRIIFTSRASFENDYQRVTRANSASA